MLKEWEFIYILTGKSVDAPVKLGPNGKKSKEEFAIQIQIYSDLLQKKGHNDLHGAVLA